MIKLESILKGAKNVARAAFVAGSLFLSACDNPVTPLIDPPIPPKPLPSISQTVELKDSVNINYLAKIKDLNEAILHISKNGNPVLSRAINDSVYSETFSYSTNKDITKGNYAFTLNGKTLSGKDTSITATVTIPNYAPEINTAGLQTGFDEGGETSISLEGKLTDKNPEDNLVPLTGAVPLDGKTQASVSGYNIKIKSIDGKTGNYSVRVEAGSSEGGVGIATLQGNIEDLLDVAGVLEDTKLHSRQPGIVKIYDEKIEPATGKNRKLGEIPVDATGGFNKRLNYRVKDLTGNILVQGKKIENGIEKSYIRTIKLPKGDVSGLELRVVSHDGLAENGISVDDFEKHVYEVLDNTTVYDIVITKYTIWKWDFGEFNSSYPFNEIIISKQPENLTVQAYFSQETAENIKRRILDKEDIGAWFNGKITNPEKIRVVEKWNLNYNDGSLDGRIVVYPSVNLNVAGVMPNNGYIKNGVILVQTTLNGETFDSHPITHESGHVSGQYGHAKTLPPNKTVMKASSNGIPRGPPLFADKKTAREIVYEDSYKHGQGKDSDGLLRVYDVLGRRFLDE